MNDLLTLLVSKIPEAFIKEITREEALQTITGITRSSLFITQDDSIEKHLNKKGSEVLLWQDLSDLAVKLDIFLQLQRCTSEFPLSLKNWRLTEVLHKSDNSIIYLAINRQGKHAAIKRFKFLPSSISEDKIKSLLKRIEKQCGHSKGLIRFYDGGICNQAFYLVMEYLNYGTLRQALDGCGNELPITHALEWFQEIVIALDRMHKAGLIHRNLKMSNLLMRSDGSLALTDYGISNRILLDAGFINEQELYCSPHYVSPEQISGDACTKASDIYSLGVIFYELLTGRKPYEAKEAYELMMHHVMAPVPLLPNKFSEFQEMLDKMMAKDPDNRYSSAIDVIEGLPIAA